MLYGDGKGVPQDYAKAVRWYEKAATQGNTEAQLNLGFLYAKGQGIAKDDVRAFMWYNLAAGHLTGADQKNAAIYRDEIASRMTPAQIAEAQKLAQERKPNK
jgi:TPR repeat protein